MAIVDSFEAMTSTQFYRDPLPIDRAAAEIERGSGTRYDPKLVEAFKKALPVMQKVRETYADQLGDLINLDFAPKGAAAKPAAAPPPAPPRPKVNPADIAKAAAAAAAAKKNE
jgi:putative two-component system response regulator